MRRDGMAVLWSVELARWATAEPAVGAAARVGLHQSQAMPKWPTGAEAADSRAASTFISDSSGSEAFASGHTWLRWCHRAVR